MRREIVTADLQKRDVLRQAYYCRMVTFRRRESEVLNSARGRRELYREPELVRSNWSGGRGDWRKQGNGSRNCPRPGQRRFSSGCTWPQRRKECRGTRGAARVECPRA